MLALSDHGNSGAFSSKANAPAELRWCRGEDVFPIGVEGARSEVRRVRKASEARFQYRAPA